MYAIVGFCASCAKNTFTLDDIFSSTWVLGQEFFGRISNALYWYECHVYSHLNRQPTEEIFKFILAQFSWYSLVAVVPLSPDEFTSSTKTNFYRKSDISYRNYKPTHPQNYISPNKPKIKNLRKFVPNEFKRLQNSIYWILYYDFSFYIKCCFFSTENPKCIVLCFLGRYNTNTPKQH